MKKRQASKRWSDEEVKVFNRLIKRYTNSATDKVDFNDLENDVERAKIARNPRDIQQRYYVMKRRAKELKVVGKGAHQPEAPTETPVVRQELNEITVRLTGLLREFITSKAYIAFRLAGGSADSWNILSPLEQKAWMEVDAALAKD